MQYSGFPSIHAYEQECARIGHTTQRIPFRKDNADFFVLVSHPPGNSPASCSAWSLIDMDETREVSSGIISSLQMLQHEALQDGTDKNYLGKLAGLGYHPSEPVPATTARPEERGKALYLAAPAPENPQQSRPGPSSLFIPNLHPTIPSYHFLAGNKTQEDNTMKHNRRRATARMIANHQAELAEYAQNTITVPESQRWQYAIPENYTNYQDGFLVQDGDLYRGRPMLNYNGITLYLFRSLPWHELASDELEKALLFDRHGNKYTFIVRPAANGELADGNPSYFAFLPLVKRYKPARHPLQK